MRRLIPLFLFFIMVLSACDQNKSVLAQITPPPNPEPGKATVVGQVLDIKTGQPLTDVVVRLADVYREGEGGMFLLNFATSPGARTDAKGFFVMTNIKPGEYVMAVGDGENLNDYDVIEDEKTGNAKIWQAVVDQISDWGVTKAQVLFR